MENIQIDITTEGKTILATAGKYCDRNIDVNVSVPGGIGIVPDYWKSHLEAKATEIDTALDAAGENRSAFLWYADAHWNDNYKRSPVILKYLSKNTGINKTFFGGDIAQKDSGELEMIRGWQELVRDVPNHHSVLGNHDYNLKTELPTAKDRAEFFFTPERTGDVVFGTNETYGKTYYYIDNHIENTRYICLGTGIQWTTDDEVAWCVDVLNSTPGGWHIVVLGHIWLTSEYHDDNTATIITTPPNYCQVFMDLFDAYNYRLTGTTSMGNAAYDFTTAKAKVEFLVGGHVHQDYDFTTTQGIPIILTECDCTLEREDDSEAVKNTTTENCVHAIVADYAAKVVKVIGVGRGYTRTLPIPDVNIVSYTNVIPTAIDFDGNILNESTTPGYAVNARYDSGSNTLLSASGIYSTGLISCAKDATVRLRNISTEPVDKYHAICIFDMNDTAGLGHYHRTRYSFSDLLGDNKDDFKVVLDENGTIIEFTLPGWQVNQTHIAICSQYIGPDSIITIGEEIDE